MGSDERKPWERHSGERNLWFQRFERYRLSGPSRSILGTVHVEQAEKGIERQSRRTPGAWSRAAEKWRWRERAEAWDEYISDKAARAAEARRLEILSSGYAQLHERVRALDELADLLFEEAYTEEKRWLPDVKQIGSGEDAERVDIVRFNAALIEQLRKTLEDLASEMGERIKKADITSAGKPLFDMEEWASRRQERLENVIEMETE